MRPGLYRWATKYGAQGTARLADLGPEWVPVGGDGRYGAMLMRRDGMMKSLFRRLYYRIFVRYQRIELRCVTPEQAHILFMYSNQHPERPQWVIAPEEDSNNNFNAVYVERRVRILG